MGTSAVFTKTGRYCAELMKAIMFSTANKLATTNTANSIMKLVIFFVGFRWMKKHIEKNEIGGIHMPLPLILGIGAAIAGAVGVGSGIHGAVKMKEANDTAKMAQEQHQRNIARYEEKQKESVKTMDDLGKQELTILKSFEEFSDVFEKIKNKPVFKTYSKDGVKIPSYNAQELKETYVGAGALLGGLGGTAAGTAGGFAAAGAAYAAVMALGTASTGTAIASLSGAAATNATLAALGGGALAAGGGGIALGTTILGASTLGVGLLVGGIIFNITGGKISDKADEAWSQMVKAQNQINEICDYFSELNKTANKYSHTLAKVYEIYRRKLNKVQYAVYTLGKTDWNDYTTEGQLEIENLVLLVGLLHNMCKVQLVLKDTTKEGFNKVNYPGVNASIFDANKFLDTRHLA